MSKRINGEGNFRQLDSGRWQGRITVTLEDGTRKAISVTRDKRHEVVQEIKGIVRRVEEGKPPVDADKTMKDWIDDWIGGPLKASGRAQSTQDQYAILLRGHIVPALGDKPLRLVKPKDIEAAIFALQQRRSASTTRSTYAALRACLDTAVRDGLIAANPVVKIQRPTQAPARPRALTVEQVRTLTKQAAGTRIQPLIVLVASTGLRRGEVLGLRWSDIDLDASMMRVSGSLSRTTAGLKRKGTKTGRDRSVALPPLAVKALKAQRAMQNADRLAAGSAWIDSGMVFTTPEGGAMEPRNVSRAYAEIATKAKIEDKGMHALRHYAATAWLSSGAATVRDVADLLGHSSPVVTLEIYAAAIPSAQRAAVDSAAAALEG